VSYNITSLYPYRGGIAYFKCIEINKAFLNKHGVSFVYLFAGPRFLIIKIWSPTLLIKSLRAMQWEMKFINYQTSILNTFYIHALINSLF